MIPKAKSNTNLSLSARTTRNAMQMTLKSSQSNQNSCKTNSAPDNQKIP